MSDLAYWNRQRLGRRSLLRGSAVATAGLAGAVLVGCSDDEDEATPEATAEGTSPAATNTPPDGDSPASESRSGGSLRVQQRGDPPNWSPLTASATTSFMNGFAYDKLLDIKTGPGVGPNQMQVEPRLAEALPEQPDELTTIFKLRQGVNFQDISPVDGRPLTTEDVKFAIDTYRETGSFARDFGPVDSVETPDESTVVVTTSEPYAPLLNLSAGHYGWKIFPRELLEQDLAQSEAIGSGPYIRDAWEQGNRIVFKRNPNYWDPNGRGFIDEFEFLIVPDTAAAAAAFRGGELDVLPGGSGSLSCVEVEDLRSQVPDAGTFEFPSNAGWFAFNSTKPPFDDDRVRKAVALLYDRDAEREAIYCGASDVLGLIPMERGLLQSEVSAEYMVRDVPEAKKLLDAAGFADGFDTTAVFTPRYGEVYTFALERALSDLRDGGINAEPVSYEYGVWIKDIYRGAYDFDGILWGPGRTYPDADPYVSYWLDPEGIANQSQVNDPTMNDLLVKQRRQLNPDERWETLHEIQRLEAENVWYIWREAGTTTFFWKPEVQDVAPHNGYDAHEYYSIWRNDVV